MSASAILRQLVHQGVHLEAQGSELIVDGPEDILVDEVVAQLKAIKADLLAILQKQDASPEWNVDDWQAYFEERAAIREHDGGLSRAEAEVLAFEDAVDHWLRLNPAPASVPGQGCVHCGQQGQLGNVLLPLLTHDSPVWVHDHCWESWRIRRRDEARAVLRDLGLQALFS